MTAYRCNVNTACRHARAEWWYWTNGDMIHFQYIRGQLPMRKAAQCCGVCRKEIIRRYKAAKKATCE